MANLPLQGENMHESTTGNFRKKDYWIVENRQYAVPSFRLCKCARMIDALANGKPCTLLDVGCGPAALRALLPRNIDYYGIDIAIQASAEYLREVDFAAGPISYDGRRFDFVTGLGILEYMGTLQTRKFQEIAKLLKPDGKLIFSYINFGHLRLRIWPNYNNVQSIAAMKNSLRGIFQVEQCFPASHHWRQKQPGKFSLRPLQMHINFNLPVLSPLFAVEYFFICSVPERKAAADAREAAMISG
jgi:SAM-dependent methyltransferase